MTVIASPRRLRLENVEMDITPMIDITFLLLIFFLVASRMDRGIALSLPEARHGTAVITKDSVVISLKARGHGEADIFRGSALQAKDRVEGVAPERLAEELGDYVRAEMREGKNHVVVRAEKRVRHRHVDQVLRALATVPGVPVYLAVLERR
ncbi:MAG TPA: biopolymer transporter ExbD [Pirellulaceae bacterium]